MSHIRNDEIAKIEAQDVVQDLREYARDRIGPHAEAKLRATLAMFIPVRFVKFVKMIWELVHG